jgi:hypothetical protein
VTFGRAAVLAAVLVGCACDTPCAFRILTRLDLGGRVACCGAADYQDVDLPDQAELAVDLAQAALQNRVGGQDLWLTRTDCEQLFEGVYLEPGTGPRLTPRCEVLLGPVSAGRVSPRAWLPPGRYRVFVQSYSTNTNANDYRVDIGVWGTSCDASPASP